MSTHFSQIAIQENSIYKPRNKEYNFIYNRKSQKKEGIFLFPALSLFITILSGTEKIKYFLTHSKTFLTDVSYNLMIDGVLGIITVTEIYIIYASFI